MMHFKHKQRRRGFSLVELLVVILMVAILAAVAVPLIINNIPGYRLKGAARMVVSDFQRAKLEAVKRNCNVEIRFTPGTYNAQGGVGSYSIVEMSGGNTLLNRTMPQYVTLYYCKKSPVKNIGYNSHGLALISGSVYLVNNLASSYKMSISTVGHVSMSHTVIPGALPGSLKAW